MLKAMKVPAKFWGEAVLTAVYVLNRSPTKSLPGKKILLKLGTRRNQMLVI